MNIQYNSLTLCTVKFLHWVIQVILQLFCLKLGLYSFTKFFIITKRISDWHHFCKWKFLLSIQQVAVSVRTIQLTLSTAIIQVLRFYCDYVGGTFCYNYVGGSFCCNYASDCFCCNYAVWSFCSVSAGESFLQQIFGWQLLLKLCTWESLLQSCR